MQNFFGKTVALGVTGGIAAYKACEIVSLLKKQGADIHVVMTKNACEFVAPLSFETLSNNRVIVDTFDRNFEREVGHISLAKKIDAFLIAPASANFIGKAANGIADDFLTTTVMACAKPIVIAPAMNTQMLLSDATQDNIKKLKNRGVHFIESAKGLLACGDSGKGRLANPNDIVDFLAKILFPKNDLNGKTVLVTAGATRENIDPVRYITNHSSGKMGLAIAIVAKNRGAKVILVHGSKPSKITTNFEKFISVTSTDQMFKAVMDNLEAADIIIKAAAPSDYKVMQDFNQKIKVHELSLNLCKNVDIASEVGKKKGNKKLVVFAAETENLIKNATKKLNDKKADLIVANDITQDGAGFNSDTNIVTLISKTKTVPYPKMSKIQVAEIILDEVLKL